MLKIAGLKKIVAWLLWLPLPILLAWMQFSGCSSSSGKGARIDSTTTTKKKEIDTLALIANEIHAAYKHQLLDSIYHNKAYLRGFNGNVLVAQKGVVVYQQCFGYSNYESKDSLKPNTKFQIASLSKTFTAVAILKLMEEGKLQLSDEVTTYFPELPFKKVTIAMLLSHRSGISNYVNVYNDKVIQGNLYPDQKTIFEWYKKFNRRYIGRSGKYFEYSNTNYVLLAGIVEKISGVSFSDYLHQQIFTPLQMNDTWLITDTNASAFTNRTQSYDAFWKRKDGDYFDGVLGDKGIYSTVLDLYKWYDALINYKILKKETIEDAWIPRSKEKRGLRNYGYGFRMICFNDTDKVVYHNGWWNSYNSLFYIHPKLNYVIIVLGNKYNNDIYDIHSAFQVMNEAVYKKEDYLE